MSSRRLTTRTACIATEDSESNAELADKSDVASNTSRPGSPTQDHLDAESQHDTNDSPVPFEGDYFGRYSPLEFDDYNEYSGNNSEGINADVGHSGDDDGDDDETDNEDANNLEAEASWEPAPASPSRSPEPEGGLDEPMDLDGEPGLPDGATKSRVHKHLSTATFVVPFPSKRAGTPISRRQERTAYKSFQAHIDSANVNPFAPFTSRLDWEVAKWAKMRGPGSTAVSELLAIENLVSQLGLSYKNSRELNAIIDKKIASGRPKFTHRKIVVAGGVYEIFYRDVDALNRPVRTDERDG
ncbi:hypothetical protein C2E23DRAFT_883732 [Lenzites betulinus]|nr:hypothetical protein C2E23DRAFT_883732 [Lenzites betulinus]